MTMTTDTTTEMFAVTTPTPDDFADPHGRLTFRQMAVILSTVAEPGDQELHAAEPADLIAALVAGEGPERWRGRFSADNIRRTFAAIERLGLHVITRGDTPWPAYPLSQLGVSGPLALYVRGNPWLLTDAQKLAIVGARASTGYGDHVTVTMATDLADRDVTIISGGAYGIDGNAHRAALAAGGRTVAFLASGLDRLYPAGHESLLTRVAETGALVSEVPPGSAPTKWRFLQRNRLIAAVSHATLVVEAGVRSGSLNTARHAFELGRTLGAVPGPITSAASAGCHRLIREFGAQCVTTTSDALELFGGRKETDR